MKKQIGLALGLAVLSTGALASKARLQALGESENGSYFVQDARNIFYNPARAVYHKDGVTMEWGDTSNTDDSAATPRAEGGILKAHGNMVYGLYFGNQADDGNGYKALAGTGINEGNTVSGLIAGEAGMQWGFGFTYGSFQNDNQYTTTTGLELGGAVDNLDTFSNREGEATLLRTRFGVITGDYEFFAKVNIINKAEAKGDIDFTSNGTVDATVDKGFEGKSGWQLGAISNIGEMTYAAIVSGISGEDTETAGAKDHKYMAIELQAGNVKQLNDKATMNWRVGVKRQTEEGAYLVTGSDQGLNSTEIAGTAFSANAKEIEILKIPMNIGLEFMAKEWLILRGSVSHNLWSSVDIDGKKSDLANSTTVNAGASFVFGDLTLDGMVGNTTGAATGEDTSASNGTLRTDALLTRVSMSYKF